MEASIIEFFNNELVHTPSIMAIVIDEAKTVEIVSSCRPMAYLETIMFELRNNIYKSRNIQKLYNDGMKLEYIYLETVTSIHHHESYNKTLLLKLKSIKYIDKFTTLGYTVIPQTGVANAIPSIENLGNEGIFIAVNNSRNARYYVQIRFNTVQEAEEYIRVKDKFELMYDTEMKHYPPDNKLIK